MSRFLLAKRDGQRILIKAVLSMDESDALLNVKSGQLLFMVDETSGAVHRVDDSVYEISPQTYCLMRQDGQPAPEFDRPLTLVATNT